MRYGEVFKFWFTFYLTLTFDLWPWELLRSISTVHPSVRERERYQLTVQQTLWGRVHCSQTRVSDRSLLHATNAKIDGNEQFLAIARPSVCRLSSVCLSSATSVHPTQAIEIFGNISTPFHTLAICWQPAKFYEDRLGETPPSVGGVKHKRGSRI